MHGVYVMLFGLCTTYAQDVKEETSPAQPQKDLKKYKRLNNRSVSLQQNVEDLLKQAEKLRKKQPQLALDKIEEALALSIVNKNQLNEARCYLLLGKVNQQIEEWDLTEANFSKAYKLLNTKLYLSTDEFYQSIEGLVAVNMAQKGLRHCFRTLKKSRAL